MEITTTARRVTAAELRSMPKNDAIRALLATTQNRRRVQEQLREIGIRVRPYVIRDIAESQPIPGRTALPEDGVIDEVAIDLAVSGTRPVALSPSERCIAVSRIIAAGGGAVDVAHRLGVDSTIAARLVRVVSRKSYETAA